MRATHTLLVDAGNSQVKWMTHGASKRERVAEQATREMTSRQVAVLAQEFSTGLVLLSSVVPEVTALFRKSFASRLQVVSAASPWLGLEFIYPHPQELGADRLAAAVAVQADGARPAIIVSCGTATAYTVLDARGRVCGGAIAPGLETQLTSLHRRAALLPTVRLRSPRRNVGRSTEEAILSGVFSQFRGGVRETLAALTREFRGAQRPRIYLTGGHARWLRGILGKDVRVRPLLVFEGLAIMADRLSNRLA